MVMQLVLGLEFPLTVCRGEELLGVLQLRPDWREYRCSLQVTQWLPWQSMVPAASPGPRWGCGCRPSSEVPSVNRRRRESTALVSAIVGYWRTSRKFIHEYDMI